ncbi:MAG: DMT family transporter [Gemmatimonadota bacterium]|nr:DMT family transporter [Gemmatimonadota bacterium]
MESTLERAAPTAQRPDARAAGVTLTDGLLLCMSIIWGVNVTVVKFAALAMPPLAFNAVRIAIAAVALSAIGALSRGPRLARRDLLALLALGTLGNGLYQFLFIEGVSRTRAGSAGIVLAASPAFIALFSRMLGVERVTRRRLLGIAASICGIGLVIFGTAAAPGGEGEHTLLGTLLVLAGTVCWSLFAVLLKPYAARLDLARVSAATMGGGAVVLLLIGAPLMSSVAWTDLGSGAVGAILFSSLGSLVIAYLFWSRGVRMVGPTRTALYGNLQPIFTLLAAWAWPALHEVPTVWQGLGAATIIAGVLLTRA